MFDLSGKVAVVTGGSRGLGRADSLALARAGADVVVTDILLESDPELQRVAEASQSALAQLFTSHNVVYAERTSAEIRAMGRRSMALKMDVTDRDQVAAVFAQASGRPARGRLPPAGSRYPHGQPRAEPGLRAVGSRGTSLLARELP